MDRRKKNIDQNALRRLRVEFYEKIDANQLSIFDAVKEMRKMSNLTQAEFAKFSDISLKIIKEIESGQANPTMKTLHQIGDFFGLQVSFIRRIQHDKEF